MRAHDRSNALGSWCYGQKLHSPDCSRARSIVSGSAEVNECGNGSPLISRSRMTSSMLTSVASMLTARAVNRSVPALAMALVRVVMVYSSVSSSVVGVLANSSSKRRPSAMRRAMQAGDGHCQWATVSYWVPQCGQV